MATISYPWAWTWDFGPSNKGSASGSRPTVEYTDVRSALTRTPNADWRPPTNYSRSITRGPTKAVSITARVDATFTGVKGFMTYAGASPVTNHHPYAMPTFPGGLKSSVERKALNKLKQQNVNLAVAFGERAATAGLVAGTATKLARAVRAARKLDIKGVGRALGVSTKTRWRPKGIPRDKQASSLWLEYQYGWQPMLNDVYGSMVELNRNDNRFADRYHCHTTATAETSVMYEQSTPSFIIGDTNMVVPMAWDTRERHRIYVRLDWVLENPLLATLSELGITNPALVAWELVPFSFVADWFIPVGSYLSALDATVGWGFRGGSCSQLTRGRKRHRITGKPYIPGTAYTNQSGFAYLTQLGFQTQTRLTRSTYGTPPFPWLPSIDGDLTKGRRAANAIALLSSAFR